jgi:hypothetical protein
LTVYKIWIEKNKTDLLGLLTIPSLRFSCLIVKLWPSFQGLKADVVVVVVVEKTSGIGDPGGSLIQLFGNIVMLQFFPVQCFFCKIISLALFQMSTYDTSLYAKSPKSNFEITKHFKPINFFKLL